MVKYLSPIDPHVHLRGTEYKTDYLGLGFRDAREVGIIAVGEQPNPTPNLTTLEAVKERLKKAKNFSGKAKHFIHIGLTTDLEQVGNAVTSICQGRAGLVSDKTFYVHSTGNMGILDEDLQREIWRIKGRRQYKGVSIGHFEDEKLFRREFDPTDPISHSIRQSEEAETCQVERQIRYAVDYRFKGIFYIAHVSSPETIDFITREKRNLPFPVIMETTWHHLLLNWEDYEIHKNRVKMNPPLRSKESQEAILEKVLGGKTDVIGSDHAPHPPESKDSDKPPSGIPALPFIPRGIELLRNEGINEDLLENLIFYNANRLFSLGLTPRTLEINYNPGLWKDYGYNPFSRLD